ncbi:F-box/LRR-repeat protein 5-like [Saccostrea echinata]|uniref:F-box/LRR-repeat protein 5-like n=1 Tax=Saccostrea echinata TaxID=191078 RepID=UPI002A811D5A|nr:F-box/LRR-repeat protein 5-like [Saccostrea echinata]
MAPNCPEEVDVFTVPHSRMKELVHKYLAMMTDTNFADVHHMTNLLENLVNAFHEFRAHEQIENKYIMKKLKAKLNALSIRSSAVCNCHSDNKLTEMLMLLQDGYHCREKGEVDRQNYGIKLRSALEDFTQKFIPHMEEEEEIFQPMLMKYFSFEELRSLKSKVIRKHQQTIEEEFVENEECVSSSSDEDEKCISESRREPQGVECLPDEVMMNIFSYLNPKELCTSAQVSKRWNSLAMDGSNWRVLRPVQWFKGLWSRQEKMDIELEERDLERAEFYPVDVKYDEDADIDESEESDDLDDMSPEWILVEKESRMLTSMVKHLFPRVGASVVELHLGYSRGLTNGVLYRMLSCCANIEVLDLTQTRVSDIGFKSLGKNRSGRKLKHINLSGCVNITDVTLQKISTALGCKEDPRTERGSENLSTCHFRGRTCCREREAHGRQQEDLGLDFDSVDAALRNACDFVEREAMARHLIDFLEGENMFSSFIHQSFLPPLLRDQQRTFELNSCIKNSSGLGTKKKSYRAMNDWNSSFTENQELFPIYHTNTNILSENSSHRINPNVERNVGDTQQRTSSSPERICGNSPYRTSASSGGNGGACYVCDNSDSDTPQRALQFLSLSGCSLVTDEGISFLAKDGGLPRLEYLDLSGCMQITAAGLSELVSTCPRLDHAQLFYCDNMLDDPYATTASGCQNLEVPTRRCCRSGY